MLKFEVMSFCLRYNNSNGTKRWEKKSLLHSSFLGALYKFYRHKWTTIELNNLNNKIFIDELPRYANFTIVYYEMQIIKAQDFFIYVDFGWEIGGCNLNRL